MGHVQTVLDEATHKEVKKDVIDRGTTLGEYIRDALIEHLNRSKGEQQQDQKR
jgi:hypothetical protein